MSTSAQGIDVSAYQLDLTAHDLAGLSFAFTKATDGLSVTDPHLPNNWAMIRHAGLHRGAYHELQAGQPTAQAVQFLAAVSAQGLEPGDMLAVVASDYPGVTDGDVLIFCDAVEVATRGRNPVLAYTDLSVGASLTRTSAAGYGLWVAWPSPTAPGPLAHWRTWTLWQWGTRNVPGLGSVDADAYNGSPAQMGAWIAGFKPKPPPPHSAAIPLQGDDIMLIPDGYTKTVAVPVPMQVPLAGGMAWGLPSVVRLTSSSPASFSIAFGSAEPAKWQPVSTDYGRSPEPVTLPLDTEGIPVAVLKLQPPSGGNPAAVTVDFA